MILKTSEAKYWNLSICSQWAMSHGMPFLSVTYSAPTFKLHSLPVIYYIHYTLHLAQTTLRATLHSSRFPFRYVTVMKMFFAMGITWLAEVVAFAIDWGHADKAAFGTGNDIVNVCKIVISLQVQKQHATSCRNDTTEWRDSTL